MPKVMVGLNSVKKLNKDLRYFGKSALVIAGKSAVESGRLKVVESELIEAEIDYIVYSDYRPEPTISQAEKVSDHVVELIKSGKKIDFIIGYGGGSSLDMAKIASLASANPKPIKQYIGVEKVPKKGLPLILIPTTAGSGSEVSKSIVLIDEIEGIKDSIVSENVIADLAVVDPLLTITMSPKLTAMTGIDALSHAIESYMSLKANAFTDSLALKAINLISTNLRRAYSNGDNIKARKAMSEAALLAGLAFSNSSNCIGHAIAYSFSAKYGIPHGMACGISLPYVMKFNMLAIPERLAEIAIAMGLEEGSLSTRELAQLAIAEVFDLITDLGLPTTLEEVGVPEEDIVKLAENMLKITRLVEANPRKLDLKDARKIFETMWRGDLETKI